MRNASQNRCILFHIAILSISFLLWAEIIPSAERKKLPQGRIDNFIKCAHACNLECVKECIEVVGHDPNSRHSRYGTTPLMAAVQCGSIEHGLDLVKYLIEHGADVNAEDSSGDNVVHWACYKPDAEVFKILLAAGLNMSLKDRSNNFPIFTLVMHEIHDNEFILDTLLNSGNDINATDSEGITPLIAAASAQITYNIKILLEKGADPRHVSHKYRKTALINACYYGPDSASLLLAQADSPLDVRDTKGRTALMYAVMKSRMETIEVLLAKGADTSLRCKEGKTALDYLPSWEKDAVKEKITGMFSAARGKRSTHEKEGCK